MRIGFKYLKREDESILCKCWFWFSIGNRLFVMLRQPMSKRIQYEFENHPQEIIAKQ